MYILTRINLVQRTGTNNLIKLFVKSNISKY